MKIVPFIAALACLIVFGCATAPGEHPTKVAAAPEEGSSYETAIVLKAKGERDGLAAEYAWIREHLPGAKVNGQSLENYQGKLYDALHLTLPDGSERDVYFAIGEFFGKF